MLALARLTLYELRQQHRLNLKTRLLIQCLDGPDKQALEWHLPPLSELDQLPLDSDFVWAQLWARAGLVEELAALPSEDQLSLHCLRAALFGDQPTVLAHLATLDHHFYLRRQLYQTALEFGSRNSIAFLLAEVPNAGSNLLHEALRMHSPQTVRAVLDLWRPDDLSSYLEEASEDENQTMATVSALLEVGATVTDKALRKAAGVSNLALLEFYYESGATKVDDALIAALKRQQEPAVAWLQAHGADPMLFLKRAIDYDLSQASELLLKYWPAYLERLQQATAYKGDVELLQKLLELGPANLKDLKGWIRRDLRAARRQAKLELLHQLQPRSWTKKLISRFS